jgi:exopolysaccharide biosynthesis WecB/TagA/CpsF family protein
VLIATLRPWSEGGNTLCEQVHNRIPYTTAIINLDPLKAHGPGGSKAYAPSGLGWSVRLIDKIAGAVAPEELLGVLKRETGSTHLVTFVNAYSYQVLRADPKLAAAFDTVYVDGILLAVLASIVKARRIVRRSFDMSSLAPLVLRSCAEGGSRIAIVGSSNEALAQFSAAACREFPGLNIVYARHGYFSSEAERESALREIERAGAEVLICGMGTGLQEQFMVHAAQLVRTLKLAFSCGGFIHQGAERLDYYPRWIDALQMRWLYRLVREKHTRKRFVRTYPRLLPVLLKDTWLYRPVKAR